MMDANAIQVRIGELCHQFRLPTMGAQSVSRFTAAGHGDALETLLEVLEQEAEDRRQRRIGRLRTASRLPAGKTWETFEHDRVPLALRQQLGELFVDRGSFVDRQDPWRQRAGLRTARHRQDPCFLLLDCAPWAERYERRSLGITSNLVFSQWEHIFANPMATAAAIDRVVHHSVILEFDVPSYRTGVAQQRSQKQGVNRQE